MNKQELIDIIRANSYSESDLLALDKLIEKYPCFNTLRFLKLRVARNVGIEIDAEEISKSVVFSSDRKQLYKWIQGEADTNFLWNGLSSSDLEFIEDSPEDTETLDPNEDTNDFESDEFDPFIDETESKAIPQKDEIEMEEVEAEVGKIIPVIDSLEEIDDEDELTEIESDSDAEGEARAGAINVSGKRNEMDLLLRNTVSEEYIRPKKSNHLIEIFLENDPGIIKADKETSLHGDVSVSSVQEDDSFITDTLAKIYVRQGLHAKAIYAYERLSLKYPEKSAYFAAQIEKIKNITNT
jgi:hypothetical protein